MTKTITETLSAGADKMLLQLGTFFGIVIAFALIGTFVARRVAPKSQTRRFIAEGFWLAGVIAGALVVVKVMR